MASQSTDNSGGREYSAFISHANADYDKGRTIADALEAKGLTCWIAPRDIRPGAEYAEEILRGISQSKCFILVLSQAANLSAHVRREVERAASRGKPIYPVRVEEVLPSPKLEYFVSMLHWLDAWDGMLVDHADRLAAAINSDEEWIGNKVVARRRILSRSLITLLAAGVIVAATVFGGDVRRFMLAADELARKELSEQGIPFDVEGLSRVVAAADVGNLARFDRAGIGVESIQSVFARPQAAEGFFRASKGNPEAINWFRSVLARNFDPNATLPGAYYERESMLTAVMRQGNLDAVLALLDAGASPHVFQDLWFTRYRMPRSVFPFSSIESATNFTKAEKGRLAEAFVRAGAIVSLPATMPEKNRGAQTERILETNQFISTNYGIEVPVVSSICEAKPTRICQSASIRTGFDWCSFAASLPARLTYDGKFLGFESVELVQLVNVVNDQAYVLVRLPYDDSFSDTYGYGYGIAEISKDGGSWNVYRYRGPAYEMGHCKKEGDWTPEACWRRVAIQRTADLKMNMSGYFSYSVSFCSR